MQELIIKKRLAKLEALYMEETLRKKPCKYFVTLLEERMRQEKTKLTLLKIGQ